MDIEKTRFDDVEPGEYEYHGFHYNVTFDSWTLNARIYDETPTSVYFIISGPQKNDPRFWEAVEYFRRECRATEIRYINHASTAIEKLLGELA